MLPPIWYANESEDGLKEIDELVTVNETGMTIAVPPAGVTVIVPE
jgi:hypothetical protein